MQHSIAGFVPAAEQLYATLVCAEIPFILVINDTGLKRSLRLQRYMRNHAISGQIQIQIQIQTVHRLPLSDLQRQDCHYVVNARSNRNVRNTLRSTISDLTGFGRWIRSPMARGHW